MNDLALLEKLGAELEAADPIDERSGRGAPRGGRLVYAGCLVVVVAVLVGTVVWGFDRGAHDEQPASVDDPEVEVRDSSGAGTTADTVTDDSNAIDDGRVYPSDLSYSVVEVSDPVRLHGGSGTLVAPLASDSSTVPPAEVFANFVAQGLPSDAKGKTVQLMFGRYTDTGYGVWDEAGKFQPTLVGKLVWVARVQGVTVFPIGPAGVESPPARTGTHDMSTVFDAQTMEPIFTVQEGTTG